MFSTADVVIVGGGPAGLAAALFAKAAGASVLLLEHNDKLGKKLYITGKGRCNVSNLCGIEEFLEQVPRNPSFLHAALAHLPPQKLREWLDSLGCPTMVERGKRVFPESQKASDVTHALTKGMLDSEVRLGAEVVSLLLDSRSIRGIRLNTGEEVKAKCLVLATGGLSYPLTGSTGVGHKLARDVGHQVSELFPSLTGLETEDAWSIRLQGLTLKNTVLAASWPKKGRFYEQGELLFTHFGISGPLALSLSSHLAGMDLKAVQAWIDLKPALEQSTLAARLERDIHQFGRKQVSSLLPEYMPASLAGEFSAIAAVPGIRQLGQLTLKECSALTNTMKHLPIQLKRHRPFSEAVITRGGVEVRQINPSSMESRLVDGLYFAGELIDVDALTGGFNLQIAFSTGALAGTSAAERAKKLY
jgi:predicted Rossmann fold flavoprotein